MNRTIVIIALTALSCYASAYDKAIDIYDDIYNQDIWKHHKLIFNFEQEISGQPTIIEKRVEDIGKYIYRHPSTMPYVQTIEPIIIEDYSDTAIEFETIPIESADNAEELLEDGDKFDDFEPKKNKQLKISIVPDQNEEKIDAFETSSPTTTDQALTNVRTTTLGSTEFNLSTKIISSTQPPKISRMNQNANRGRVKFNLMDFIEGKVYEDVSMENETTDKSNQEAPPVPTLSPWYDGYGKK